MDLREWAKVIGAKIALRGEIDGDNCWLHATLEKNHRSAYVRGDGVLIGVFGRSENNVDEALSDLAHSLSGEIVVFDAHPAIGTSHTFNAPQLEHNAIQS